VNCEIVNSGTVPFGSGISVVGSVNIHLENTTIYDSTKGFHLFGVSNSTIIGCSAFHNRIGIVLEHTNHSKILDNSVYGNSQYGIQIALYSHNNSVYGNSIGWNDPTSDTRRNAVDMGEDNYFDDNISIGNYWSDYTGLGFYVIPGSANSVDSFAQFLLDFVAPFLSNQPDIVIDIDTDGNTLTWSAYDEFPHSYIIWENDERLGPFIWPGGNITASIDHLEEGPHEVNITVFDGAGNHASDDVLIYVISYPWPPIDTELVLFASFTTVVIFVIVLLLYKRFV
jgi:parallel beta-helix repeat protein